ncbi:MAG: ATP synthase F1 subunit epsilon [Minicystis sp.]
MASETIQLEIVTPTGVALRQKVDDVTAPSVDGEFGVLPGHLPVLAALRTGLVTYHLSGVEHRVAVHHGFIEIVNDAALLLTERFAKKEDVDIVKVRLRLKEVDAELDHWEGELTDPRRRELIEEEQWLAAQLELIGDAPPPTVREDTRYLVEHAEPPSLEDQARAGQSDPNLTDTGGDGGPFGDT